MKPETWTDSKVVALSPLARLLFIGSWNFADDYGCLPADAMQLKLRVLPADEGDAVELVTELLEEGLLEHLVSEDGREFWHITNWSKHQRVNRPSDSEYGDPTTWKPATRGFSEDSLPVVEDSRGKGTEGNGREGNGIAPREAPRGDLATLKNTLVELCGEPPPSGWSLYNRVATWIRDRGGTPEEIRFKAGRIADEWGVKAVTVPSLEKHWTRYDSEVGQLTDDDVEKYQAEVRRLERERRAAELDAEARGLPS